ncbi:MAG: hypothetical protein J5792_00410, partial [Bacteroidales bacterium]|nr:hypothetical protein [Bacteroidales bacterium]
MNYRKRIADDILRSLLASSGAVLIQGPKWCGKITTAEQMAASSIYMNDPEEMEENIMLAASQIYRTLRDEETHQQEKGCWHRLCPEHPA